MAREIHIHIDRIVLDGPAPTNRRALRAAVQQQLARLISEQGLPGGNAARPYQRVIHGGAVRVGNGNDPARTGAGIARGVYQSLNQKQ